MDYYFPKPAEQSQERKGEDQGFERYLPDGRIHPKGDLNTQAERATVTEPICLGWREQPMPAQHDERHQSRSCLEPSQVQEHAPLASDVPIRS